MFLGSLSPSPGLTSPKKFAPHWSRSPKVLARDSVSPVLMKIILSTRSHENEGDLNEFFNSSRRRWTQISIFQSSMRYKRSSSSFTSFKSILPSNPNSILANSNSESVPKRDSLFLGLGREIFSSQTRQYHIQFEICLAVEKPKCSEGTSASGVMILFFYLFCLLFNKNLGCRKV
jgi:curved DNA-binding protein CbpA